MRSELSGSSPADRDGGSVYHAGSGLLSIYGTMPATISHSEAHVDRGDTSGKSEQLVQIRRRLHDAVKHVCPQSLSSHAEDITQEAWLRVTAALEREGERERPLPASYIRRTAYNATVDAIRRHRTRRHQEQPMNEAIENNPGPPRQGNPHRELAAKELSSGIEGCLGEMVKPRRVAVILHLQGHTVAEVGRLLGWPATRANNLVYRGLRSLRHCLSTRGLAP